MMLPVAQPPALACLDVLHEPACNNEDCVWQVWEAIDAHMDDRRRAIREKKLKEDIEKYRKENPKITEQFADLKRKLAQISEDEWNAIPDIGDYTRHKKNKMEVSQLTLNALPHG